MNAPLQLPSTDRTSEVSAFSEYAVWTGITDESRSDWLKARRHIITASRIPALLGLSPFEDAIDVYVDAITEGPANDEELGMSDPRKWGKALERSIAETAAGFYGWNLRMSGALLVSRRYPWIGCTQDAEVEEVPGSEIWCSYEGKTVSQFKARDWDEDNGRAPDHVIAQTQAQLLVTGAPKTIISCLIGGNRFVRIDHSPIDDFAAVILEAVDEMRDRIAMLDPPPPTFRSKKAIAALYPEDDGTSVVLSKDAQEWTRELLEIAPKQKELEQRSEALRNMIKLEIGESSTGVLVDEIDGKTRWTNNLIRRAGYQVNPTSFRQLRLSGEPKKKRAR